MATTTEDIEDARRRAQEAAAVYERTLLMDDVNADDLHVLLGLSGAENDNLATQTNLKRSRSDDTMLRDDSETSNTVAISPEGAATDVHSSTNQRRAFLPMGSSRNGFCSEGMANVARSVDDNVSAAVPIVKMRYRSSPTEGSKAADRNSFFDLLAAHRTADALRDQRSPGPPLGRQYFSPGELADEDSSQHSSPGSTGNSRQSPLHWLVKMGVAEHDGNLPISIRRPKKEERAVSPPIKRVKQQPSTFLKRLRSGSSEMSLDKTETERLKKVRI